MPAGQRDRWTGEPDCTEQSARGADAWKDDARKFLAPRSKTLWAEGFHASDRRGYSCGDYALMAHRVSMLEHGTPGVR